jgi:peptidoglycan/xylan/chitin deacetylase (PgdA/CDA1 family)
MRLDRFVSLRLVRPFFKGAPAPQQTIIPMLMYHSISDDAESGVAPYYRIVTSPPVFRKHMQLLKTEGYQGVDIKTGLAALNQASGSNEKLAVITFDDGYRDFCTNAFPLLREFGFSATMFLPTAFIGKQTRIFNARECLSWSDVRDLQTQGIHFGSHTVNHPKLVELAWPQIKTELTDSKKEIENQLGAVADSFAYPFAFPETRCDFVTRFSATLAECGYRSCATTRVGRARTGDDPMRLKRLPANSCDDDQFLQAKLAGAYDWIAPLQFGVKKVKSIVSRRRPGCHCKSPGQSSCQHA